MAILLITSLPLSRELCSSRFHNTCNGTRPSLAAPGDHYQFAKSKRNLSTGAVMTHPKFPTRKHDGSFCVEVGLRIHLDDSTPDIAARIQSWFNDDWISRNKTWTRTWASGPNLATKRDEVLSYSDEFLAIPEVEEAGAELRIRLFGARTARFWKDWLVSKIAPDLKAQFPQVGELLYIRDCDSDTQGSPMN
ncbi:hypothetical protein [Dyella nitratireducens]|uniref:Uncharacterized protein n=1 Tax=Dyella nitratireducens TaxID=1849580 RepID=A0ABQ1GAM5_9GAMM|nr:hypothetical protein [Dyella nitratireducens]GGA39957.1 hypothetical protein GCM10010981_31520 [Dyella nitratireducens]GLQ40509.1 hypothetical protein GCM10007902_03580 [Dyella nitratireducens]